MRASDLPTPGILSNGQTLRHQTAIAISRAEINADRSATSDTAENLRLLKLRLTCTMQRKNNSIRERGQERQGEGG